jgi:DNA-binding protein HU-beta
MTKTKKDLISKISKVTGINKNEVGVVVNSFLYEISECIMLGNKLELRKFGIFYTKHRGPKQARNPKTGVAVKVPERTVPVFKASKFLFKKRSK